MKSLKEINPAKLISFWTVLKTYFTSEVGNIGGFWDGLISQVDHMDKEGFVHMKPEELFFASNDQSKILEFLKSSC